MIEIKVFNNNIEFALKKLKRKVKDSRLFIELREKEFYQKKSDIRRELISKAKLRTKYQNLESKELH
jgi:ribosomal protein S21